MCAAADLRPNIRRHPLVATGLVAALGFVGVPIVPHAFRWIVRTATRVPQLAAQVPGGASGFALNALRGFRARR